MPPSPNRKRTTSATSWRRPSPPWASGTTRWTTRTGGPNDDACDRGLAAGTGEGLARRRARRTGPAAVRHAPTAPGDAGRLGQRGGSRGRLAGGTPTATGFGRRRHRRVRPVGPGPGRDEGGVAPKARPMNVIVPLVARWDVIDAADEYESQVRGLGQRFLSAVDDAVRRIGSQPRA